MTERCVRFVLCIVQYNLICCVLVCVACLCLLFRFSFFFLKQPNRVFGSDRVDHNLIRFRRIHPIGFH